MEDTVIIVDADGTEHEFPAGFDPKRAADIVRYQANDKAANAPVSEPTTAEETFRQFKSGQFQPGIMGTPLTGSKALANAAGAVPAGRILSAGIGAVRGAAGRLPIVGSMGRAAVGGAIKGWGAGAPAVSGAAETAAGAGRLILGPAEIAVQDQLKRMAAQQASKVGMAHAAGGTIRDELLKLLGR